MFVRVIVWLFLSVILPAFHSVCLSFILSFFLFYFLDTRHFPSGFLFFCFLFVCGVCVSVCVCLCVCLCVWAGIGRREGGGVATVADAWSVFLSKNTVSPVRDIWLCMYSLATYVWYKCLLWTPSPRLFPPCVKCVASKSPTVAAGSHSLALSDCQSVVVYWGKVYTTFYHDVDDGDAGAVNLHLFVWKELSAIYKFAFIYSFVLVIIVIMVLMRIVTV